MNPLISKAVQESDFIWDAVVENLPIGTKRSRTGFINFNCPMCVSRGETPDTKKRGGIARISDGVRVSCFNCGFKVIFRIGESHLSGKFKSFLNQLGLSELEINRLNHKAFQLSRILGDPGKRAVAMPERFIPSFPEVALPPDTYSLGFWADHDLTDKSYLSAVSYALERGDEVAKRAYWCPDFADRLIFPCQYRGKIVGWTGRLVPSSSLQKNVPKYLNEVPENFLSNCDVMNDPERKFLLVPEGFLDAEVIDGVSPFGAKLSPNQISWIRETGKTPIVIPDRDKSGGRLIEIALEQGWHVAFPRITRPGNNWWEADCKDCTEAVKRYGRLYTLRSIVETATQNPLEINIKRKWLY